MECGLCRQQEGEQEIASDDAEKHEPVNAQASSTESLFARYECSKQDCIWHTSACQVQAQWAVCMRHKPTRQVGSH